MYEVIFFYFLFHARKADSALDLIGTRKLFVRSLVRPAEISLDILWTNERFFLFCPCAVLSVVTNIFEAFIRE